MSEVYPESPKQSLLRRAAARFISELHLIREQLSTADLNPHEGKLRGSQIDAKYMDIPEDVSGLDSDENS